MANIEESKKKTFSLASIQASIGALRVSTSSERENNAGFRRSLDDAYENEGDSLNTGDRGGDRGATASTGDGSSAAVVHKLKETFTKGIKDVKKAAKITISAFAEDASDRRPDGQQVDIFSASVYEVVKDLGSEAAKSIHEAKNSTMKIGKGFPKLKNHNLLTLGRSPHKSNTVDAEKRVPFGDQRSTEEDAVSALEFDVEPAVPELYDPESVEYLKRATQLQTDASPAMKLTATSTNMPVVESLLVGADDDEDNESEVLSEVSLELELELDADDEEGIGHDGVDPNEDDNDDNCV
jgi:hypothetical protein